MNRLFYILLLIFVEVLPALGQRHQVRREGQLLAYDLSFDPRHITPDMPPALQELLRAYQIQSRYAQRQQGRAVAPLLKSIRHQEDPFNRACPYYLDNDGRPSQERCLTGCVATSLEQVIFYHRHPQALVDTLHGWTTEHYTIPDILPSTPIDWDNILPDYRMGYTEAQAKAVADLTYMCGVATHMNWGLESSGANMGLAFEPLWRAFGYQTLAYISRAMYDTPMWNAMLRRELEAGRPVCYTGHNIAMGGHAFNIDGVDEQGFYHLCWGYGGDFDGYFDLDYLNPFESPDDATPLGQNEGFFSNQTALFMHPEDFVIDVYDTLSREDAFLGVRVDGLHFRRQPDTQEFVIADFTMTNTTQDSLNFTFEVFTFLPTDTAIFRQADYVALSAVNLAPGESKTWPIYCQFHRTGQREFAISADDVTIPYSTSVEIIMGTPPQLTFGEVSHQLVRYEDNLVVDLSLDVYNSALSGCAGNLVTYCLFPQGQSVDLRHWQVLQLPGGTSQELTTRFQHLVDGQTYTLLVRCPWEVQQTYTFTACASEAVDGIDTLPNFQSIMRNEIEAEYDLRGRRVSTSSIHPKGVYIKHGKKIFIP